MKIDWESLEQSQARGEHLMMLFLHIYCLSYRDPESLAGTHNPTANGWLSQGLNPISEQLANLWREERLERQTKESRRGHRV